MKAFGKVFGWMAIVGAVVLYASISMAESLGAMRLVIEQGDVQVKIADTGEWVPASVNMPIVEGDELWVPASSRAALQTNNGAHIRLDGDTALQVLRMDRDSFQFYLAQGYAYVLSLAPKRSVLQFDTPDASIRAFGNATFRIDIPGGETDVSVLKGSVLAENDAGTTTVRAGSTLALGADGYAEHSPLLLPDDWERWNRDRDRVVLARGEGYRRLPGELRMYSGDFDENGRWVNAGEYGYVWTPTVVVIADWAPYRHGRWVWRGGDYVWIGYEPWGWAPYHYGRWAFAVNIGWLWGPPARGGVFLAPGYVGWGGRGDHVVWVPLAPREVYYGRGNYGRYSTNITNVNITQVRVTNVYRNTNVTNSITVVNRTTFVTGRPSSVDRNVVGNVREDFAKRRNIVVGSPPIKPVETSYVPVVRQIPEAKRPPTAVRKIDVKELRQTRPLVKEPGRSAIRPQAQPRPLEVKKVEKPRSLSERTRERQQEAPPERGSTQEAPAERGRPQETAPPEKARPQGTPAEKGRPQEIPAEKGKLKEAPPERGRPQQTAPPRKARPQVAPAERGRPQEAPAEKGKLKEAQAEKGKSKEAPPDNVLRETPRGGTGRGGEKGRR